MNQNMLTSFFFFFFNASLFFGTSSTPIWEIKHFNIPLYMRQWHYYLLFLLDFFFKLYVKTNDVSVSAVPEPVNRGPIKCHPHFLSF